MENLQIIIVDRERQERFPRSKKRRIRNKWRKDRRNWGPLMVPVGQTLLMGSAAVLRGYDAEKVKKAFSQRVEMHSKLWEKIQNEYPEVAAKCEIIPADEPYKFT